MVSAERLFLVDPYNEKHFQLMQDFERRNEISTNITNSITKLIATTPKDEYLKSKKESNDINETLFIEQNGKVKDSCTIHGEKDRKSCTITFPSIKAKLRNRALITIATDYALNTLGLHEAFSIIPQPNQSMMSMLESQGYENLGEENNNIMYLKEKEQQNIIQRVV